MIFTPMTLLQLVVGAVLVYLIYRVARPTRVEPSLEQREVLRQYDELLEEIGTQALAPTLSLGRKVNAMRLTLTRLTEGSPDAPRP